MTPLECGIIFDGIPEGAISRKVGLIWGIPDNMAHPNIPDIVMNYDHEVIENFTDNDFAKGQDRWEADCSPHPFDILAIYALYQTVE